MWQGRRLLLDLHVAEAESRRGEGRGGEGRCRGIEVLGGDVELVLGGQVTLASELVEHDLLFADLLLLIVCAVRKTERNRAGYSARFSLGSA